MPQQDIAKAQRSAVVHPIMLSSNWLSDTLSLGTDTLNPVATVARFLLPCEHGKCSFYMQLQKLNLCYHTSQYCPRYSGLH